MKSTKAEQSKLVCRLPTLNKREGKSEQYEERNINIGAFFDLTTLAVRTRHYHLVKKLSKLVALVSFVFLFP